MPAQEKRGTHRCPALSSVIPLNSDAHHDTQNASTRRMSCTLGIISGMHPTNTGVAALAPPHVDVLHTIRLPRTIRDAHYLHRLCEALTEGCDRTLWALPADQLLIIRAPRVDETRLPAGAHLSTTTRNLPADHACVEWALVANPCKATGPRGDDGRIIGRSKRVPLPEGEVPAWAMRKLAGALSDIEVSGHKKLNALPGHNPKTGRTITHHRYAITGTAVVEDQGELAHLLAAGVGPGKAFGCGLLTVGERT